MADGHIVESGPTEHVLTDPQQEYTKRLLADTPQTRRARLVTGDGHVAPGYEAVRGISRLFVSPAMPGERWRPVDGELVVDVW